MASGTFRTPTNRSAGSGYSRYIYVEWTSENNTSNNTSTIHWEAFGGSEDSSVTSWVWVAPIRITIDNTLVLNRTSRFKLSKGQSIGSGDITVTHGSDGAKTVDVSIEAAIYSSSVNNTYSGTIRMSSNPTYDLTITKDSGCTVTVTRTSSAGYGETGVLTAGENKLCGGDILKIVYAANNNYALVSHTVNGSDFASENTFIVNGDVHVNAVSQALASSVGATDANIGSVSTVTITKYNPNHYHSLQYSFNGLTGYITSSGNISNAESKFSETSVAFSVPISFYSEISDAQTGTCTLTCRTYSSADSSTVLGEPTTCSFTLIASPSENAPVVHGTVIDTNIVTASLTGDNTVLVRYKSNATCTISATPKNSSVIISKSVNDIILDSNSKVFTDVSESSFTFKATDSRGYTSFETITPTIIPYIQLSCNPLISRTSPTGSEMTLTVSGNIFRGSFGAYSNTLSLRYRFKEKGGTFGNWGAINTVPSIVYGTDSYRTNTDIVLSDVFDYRKDYIFEIQAYDGTSNSVLSVVTKEVFVPRGIPIFDWGENDFNVNVPLKLNEVNIMDIIYPVGSVYWSSSNSLPSSISNIGTWRRIYTTGVSGVNAWERTL